PAPPRSRAHGTLDLVGQTMTAAPRDSHVITGARRSRQGAANFTIFSAGFPARSGHGLGSHFGQLGALEGSGPGTLGTAHERRTRSGGGSPRPVGGTYPDGVRHRQRGSRSPAA